MYIIPLTLWLLALSLSEQDVRMLFDGKTLDYWEIIDYDGHGDVVVISGKAGVGCPPQC